MHVFLALELFLRPEMVCACGLQMTDTGRGERIHVLLDFTHEYREQPRPAMLDQDYSVPFILVERFQQGPQVGSVIPMSVIPYTDLKPAKPEKILGAVAEDRETFLPGDMSFHDLPHSLRVLCKLFLEWLLLQLFFDGPQHLRQDRLEAAAGISRPRRIGREVHAESWTPGLRLSLHQLLEISN